MGDLLTVDRQLGEGEQGGDTGGVLGGDSPVVDTGSPPLHIVMSGQLLQAAEVHNSPHSQLCPVPANWDTAVWTVVDFSCSRQMKSTTVLTPSSAQFLQSGTLQCGLLWTLAAPGS